MKKRKIVKKRKEVRENFQPKQTFDYDKIVALVLISLGILTTMFSYSLKLTGHFIYPETINNGISFGAILFLAGVFLAGVLKFKEFFKKN